MNEKRMERRGCKQVQNKIKSIKRKIYITMFLFKC